MCIRDSGWPTFTVAQFKMMVGNGIPKLVERFSPADALSLIHISSAASPSVRRARSSRTPSRQLTCTVPSASTCQRLA